MMRWRLPILSGRRRNRYDAPPALRAVPLPTPGDKRLAELRALERRLGHEFENPALLDRALTHRSFLHDAGKQGRSQDTRDYEALEFFGDAILGLIISEELFLAQPDLHEGELSKLKAHLVSAKQLSRLSRELELSRFVRLSHGEEKTGGRGKKAILADLFESLTAALYLDAGLEGARRFVLSRFRPLLDEIDSDRFHVRDYKSTLQELLHSRGLSEPSYKVVAESGPDHRKEFLIEVFSGGQALARGQGLSKKEAEQRAAHIALEVLRKAAAAGPS